MSTSQVFQRSLLKEQQPTQESFLYLFANQSDQLSVIGVVTGVSVPARPLFTIPLLAIKGYRSIFNIVLSLSGKNLILPEF